MGGSGFLTSGAGLGGSGGFLVPNPGQGTPMLPENPLFRLVPNRFGKQNVVPVFEGWLRNPDGAFTMVFGYFNRNLKEELAIPPGPENKIEPGELDRGQPTYFLPRRQA